MPDTPVHWAEDEDLRERFVLQRLDAERLRECEAHLETCPSCRSLVASEREIITGIRLEGREVLKRSLSQETQTAASRGPTWRMSAAIAAGTAFLLALAVATVWLLQQKGEMLVPGGKEIAQQTDTAADHLGKKAPATIAQQAPSTYRGTKATTDAKSEKEVGRIRPDRQGALPSGTARPEAPMTSHTTSRREEEWVIGTILTASPRERESRRPAITQDERSVLKRGKNEETVTEEQANRQVQATKPLPAIALRQRPSRELSSAGQDRFGQRSPLGIMTQAQRTRGGLTLTLFVDTLFAEDDLQQANVTRVRGDSLIVQISGTRLGYKLPPGWLAY
jgi:hypothetical protein